MDYAIVIGVERYNDKAIPTVVYAEADATAIARALEALGFSTSNQVVLLSGKATKATIESVVDRIARALTAEDRLFVFYAGHGFSANGKNYLTCADTQLADLPRTSVQLQFVFDRTRASKSKRVVFFIDACESGMPADSSIRGVFSHMTPAELEDFFRGSEFCVCFSACRDDEKSFSSDTLRHGIWTYHVIEAVTGNAPLALEQGIVTSQTLQNYLAHEVPRSVRATRAKPEVQTPWVCGAMSKEFVIADLRSTLAARQKAKLAKAKEMRQAFLFSVRTEDVRSLSGFERRRHEVPTSVNSATKAFVGRIAEAELKEHLDKVYDGLKSRLGYKRRDLKSSLGIGEGSIVTPDFEYRVTIGLDPNDPSTAVWRYEVTRITNSEVVRSEEFSGVLGRVLDTIEYEFASPFEIDDFIDLIEDRAPQGISVKYPRDCSECEVRIDGFDGVLVITPGSIRLTGLSRSSPRALVDNLFTAQRLLVEKHQVLALPL